MSQHHAGLAPALVEPIAGLTAGSVATLVVHPLDIVKTRMQIHRSSSAASASAAAPRLDTVTLVRRLVADAPSPVAALYRGLAPNLLGGALAWGSFFFFKARAEQAILAVKSSSSSSSSSSLSSSSSSSSSSAPVLTPRDYFVASAVGGLFTQALTNPIWVLKTRMVSSDRGAAGAYPSMRAGALAILRSPEGWRGFYRGLAISLVGVTHGAVQFAVYEPLKRVYLSRRRRRQQEQEQEQLLSSLPSPSSASSSTSTHHHHSSRSSSSSSSSHHEKMGNDATLVLSSASKLVAGAATYPYQVIRSRLQNYDAEARFGRGIRGVAARLWREEGWRGFYRGIVPGVVRVLPATWVTFLVYENARFYLGRLTVSAAETSVA